MSALFFYLFFILAKAKLAKEIDVAEVFLTGKFCRCGAVYLPERRKLG